MTFSTQVAGHDSVATINITPLVDVMLVLLVIFMMAAPILTQRIGMDLPGAAPPQPLKRPPPPIHLRIDAAGQLYWNGNPTQVASLQTLLESERARAGGDMATLQIDSSDDADYGQVARVLAAASNAHWTRVGFVRR